MMLEYRCIEQIEENELMIGKLRFLLPGPSFGGAECEYQKENTSKTRERESETYNEVGTDARTDPTRT